MERLYVFAYTNPDSLLEGLIHSAGIRFDVNDGLMQCLVDTKMQRKLMHTLIRKQIGQGSFISVNLRNNFAFWHFFTGHKSKFAGKWK